MVDNLPASGRKTGQRRVGLLNRINTFLRECGSGVKAGIRRGGNATRKKGDNRGRTIRKSWKSGSGSRSSSGSGSRSSVLRRLLLLRSSIFLSKNAIGQRTGVAATRTAEAMEARIMKRILVRILSSSSGR